MGFMIMKPKIIMMITLIIIKMIMVKELGIASYTAEIINTMT